MAALQTSIAGNTAQPPGARTPQQAVEHGFGLIILVMALEQPILLFHTLLKGIVARLASCALKAPPVVRHCDLLGDQGDAKTITDMLAMAGPGIRLGQQTMIHM
jgi:hypothetical protein